MNSISRAFFFLFGLIIKSFGLTCIILSNLGTGAWEGLYVGLSKKIGFSVGIWLILIGVLIIIGNSLLLKKRPKFISLLTVLLLGSLIDIWLHVLQVDILDFHKQMIVFWIGLISAAIGVAVYVQAQFAFTPIDQLMYALSDYLRINVMCSKTIGELVALLLSFMVQGPVGLGTIIFTLLFGPLIQFFLKQVYRIMNS